MYLSNHSKNLISAEEKVAELIAEVERLKRAYEYDHKCLYEVRGRCELWKQRAEKAEAECLEQARLLGKGAEREADLRGKVERLERALLTNGSERSEVKFFEKLSQKHGIKIDGCYE